jgi:uncharacterized membrane protein YgaE (UPF0421/DUF939 family)
MIPRDRRILMRKRASLNNQIAAASWNMERRRLEHLKEKIEDTERQLQDSHEAEQQVAEARAVASFERIPNISTNMPSQSQNQSISRVFEK